MRLHTLILISLIFLGGFGGVEVSANATPQEKAGDQEAARVQEEVACTARLNQAQGIVLAPFFQLQRKDSKVWIERIIVTFLLAAPRDFQKYDLNNPAFRKMLYDLLQSDKPETAVQSQAAADLSQVLGMNIEAAVEISRSVIIVR